MRPVQLDKQQKTVFVDVLNWYISEELDETDDAEMIEEYEQCIEKMNSESVYDPELAEPQFLRQTVMENYKIDLEQALMESPDMQSEMEFYEEALKSIVKLLLQTENYST